MLRGWKQSLSLVQCLQLFLSARFYSDCPANKEMPLRYDSNANSGLLFVSCVVTDACFLKLSGGTLFYSLQFQC